MDFRTLMKIFSETRKKICFWEEYKKPNQKKFNQKTPKNNKKDQKEKEPHLTKKWKLKKSKRNLLILIKSQEYIKRY